METIDKIATLLVAQAAVREFCAKLTALEPTGIPLCHFDALPEHMIATANEWCRELDSIIEYIAEKDADAQREYAALEYDTSEEDSWEFRR